METEGNVTNKPWGEAWCRVPIELYNEVQEHARGVDRPLSYFWKKWILEGYKREFGVNK
jgi:hypothetical protein